MLHFTLKKFDSLWQYINDNRIRIDKNAIKEFDLTKCEIKKKVSKQEWKDDEEFDEDAPEYPVYAAIESP